MVNWELMRSQHVQDPLLAPHPYQPPSFPGSVLPGKLGSVGS